MFAELPAIMIVGPRASGKTTTARQHAATVLQLDRPAEAEAVRADPDAAFRGLAEPVLIDEWQVVPSVLGAVKRTVDGDFRPGRFLLTGSVRAEIEEQSWPGTGRVIRLAMTGLTERELAGGVEGPTYLDLLADGGVDALINPSDSPDLRDYVQLALRGGFPEPALRLSEDARREWWDGYVEQMLTRDAKQFADRDPQRLSRYLEAVSLNSAGIVEDKTIYDAAGVNRKTALAYEDLLQALYLLDVVPAWTTNRLKRLVRAPKRYLTDPALFAAGAKVSLDAVMRDANLLGRVLDTFVAAQLRAELPIGASRTRLFHLRQYDGRHEVDLIAELDAHRVIGIEIKADSAPGSSSAHHLRWLRDELGDRFVAGIVMHTGPRVYRLDDRIVAAPIATLWN